MRYLAFYVVVSGIDQRNTCEPQICSTQYLKSIQCKILRAQIYGRFGRYIDLMTKVAIDLARFKIETDETNSGFFVDSLRRKFRKTISKGAKTPADGSRSDRNGQIDLVATQALCFSRNVDR